MDARTSQMDFYTLTLMGSCQIGQQSHHIWRHHKYICACMHAYIYNKKFLLVCLWLFAQYPGIRHEKLINRVCIVIQQKYCVGKCVS